MSKKKSIMTTIFGAGGLFAILGTVLSALFDGDPATNPQWGLLISAAMPCVAAIFARDHSVSSKSAGVKED
jgi:hypothetical protein